MKLSPNFELSELLHSELAIRNDLTDMRAELREASRKIERYFDRREERR